MIASLIDAASGMVILGCLFAALFFMRFWRGSADRFFLMFAAAFLLMALGPAVQLLTGARSDYRMPVYALRLAAYVLIILAIVDKNRTRPS